MPWRFFVMIWFEATQSDQPEITWMFERDRVALRVDQVVALVREPVVGEQLLRRRRVVRGQRLRLGLHRRVGDPLREQAVEPDRVGGRRVAVLTELRDRVAVDRHRQRVPEGDEAVRVLRVVEDQRDRVRRRRVEGVEVRLVLRRVRLVDVRDEVVRPVDLAALDQGERRVVRCCLNVLEAVDQRLAGLPVAGVLAEHEVLGREPQ